MHVVVVHDIVGGKQPPGISRYRKVGFNYRYCCCRWGEGEEKRLRERKGRKREVTGRGKRERRGRCGWNSCLVRSKARTGEVFASANYRPPVELALASKLLV